ncbi:juvenile hormone acid O-methyltransferase [Rhipicephalus sanguineus]|uniref:juvenile hormone acid O-methyltransferase n=1 Tax=Rhipicephalus sanguineus TaxID=34632 RepID=UPI001894A7EA|nr:juvenile hormone acid O-methyltransferase [Rhipicephalus sanguineus]
MTMNGNVQHKPDKPGYDADAYSECVDCYFPTMTKLLNYYNMTFNNALDEDVLNESPTSRWPRQFLDVGSGCGRVTLNVILPNVPDDVEKIVGVDICENMVSYARQNNSHPRIVYEKLDIRGDVSEFLELYGPFDRIYGFNSLNRVKEQSKAWNNMAKLLKPGGECLLFYSAWYSTPDVWRALALKERWSGFAEMWESLIPPSQDMRNTEERLNYARSLAKDAGLELRSCEMVGIYLPVRAWSGMMTSLIPGHDTLSAEERQLLFEDANEELQKWRRGRPNPRLADNYVIHGIKPMTGSS